MSRSNIEARIWTMQRHAVGFEVAFSERLSLWSDASPSITYGEPESDGAAVIDMDDTVRIWSADGFVPGVVVAGAYNWALRALIAQARQEGALARDT